jgi:hypothetical protein
MNATLSEGTTNPAAINHENERATIAEERINLAPLRHLSAERWEALCRYLQPRGRKEGYHWLAGSVNGEPGHSFNVNLQTGLFCDWATGERAQRGAINYWMAIRNVGFKIALRELAAWLGSPTTVAAFSQKQGLHAPPVGEKQIRFPEGFCLPTERDLEILGRHRSICIEALRIATQRGLLYCFDDQLNGRCWLFTDQRRKCALRRRLDNQPFQLATGRSVKSAACFGSEMRSPLGYQEAKAYPCIGIIEGAPDALSMLAHAWADGVQDRIAPVCMPSRTANFTESVLGYLQGKRARIFIDNDTPGQEAAGHWALQLAKANITVDGFSFRSLVMTDGHPVKDLNDTLRIDYDCWEEFRNQIDAIMNFGLL